MKKITLASFLMISAFAFSQFTGAPSGTTFLGSERQAIILDQIEDGINTIVSCTNTPQAATILCADDFSITETTRIDAITIRGTVNNGLAANITGWDFYIYTDNAGVPGQDPNDLTGAPLALQNISGAGITIVDDGVTAVDVEFDIQTLFGDLELDAGTYWISVGPIMNITDVGDNTATGERFNWDSSSDINGSEPHIIDVTDFFGAGLLTYTPFSAIGVAVGSLSFSIEGDDALSLEDNVLADSVSIFPNPTNADMNISFSRSLGEASVQFINITGQKVMEQTVDAIGTSALNTSRLSSGIYFAQIATEDASTVIKFIKN